MKARDLTDVSLSRSGHWLGRSGRDPEPPDRQRDEPTDAEEAAAAVPVFYRDLDFFDRDQDEKATGLDPFDPEWPYTPLRFSKTSQPITPAAASPPIHVDPMAGSDHADPGDKPSSLSPGCVPSSRP